jgi:hypothetical protein
MVRLASREPGKPQPFSWHGILKANDFRDAYHQALDLADKTPEAQRTAARRIIEEYFCLQGIAATAVLNRNSLYFADKPIMANGVFKFLIPGTIKRELIDVPLFLLKTKSSHLEPLVEAKEFERAIASVEAVRLTLTPERVNGILSFISDAKQFYVDGDSAGAEKAIGTAVDHLNRAAAEGLRRFTAGAEKGRRGNEIVGTQRTLANLRKKLQAERRLPTTATSSCKPS